MERYEDINSSIVEGPKIFTMVTPEVPETGVVGKEIQKSGDKLTEKERFRMKGDQLAKSYLLQSLRNEIYVKIDSHKASTKAMWDQIKKLMMG